MLLQFYGQQLGTLRKAKGWQLGTAQEEALSLGAGAVMAQREHTKNPTMIKRVMSCRPYDTINLNL